MEFFLFYYERFKEILKNTYNDIINDKKILLFLLILITIFALLSYNLYNNFIKPYFSEHTLNKEFTNEDKEDYKSSVNIILFYTEWCPYCKQIKPEWNKFEKYVYKFNNTKNDDKKYKILLTTIDCEKNSEMCDKYNIKGYPSIKMVYDKKVYDYDAEIELETLQKFIKTFVDE